MQESSTPQAGTPPQSVSSATTAKVDRIPITFAPEQLAQFDLLLNAFGQHIGQMIGVVTDAVELARDVVSDLTVLQKLSDENAELRSLVSARRENDRARQAKRRESASRDSHVTDLLYVQDQVPVQEQVQDQDHIKAASRDAFGPGLLAAMWNTHRGDKLPACVVLNGPRRAKASARIKSHPDPKQWLSLIECVASNPWLCGENNDGWRADFDWLIKPGTMVKFIEGKLATRRKVARTAEEQRQQTRDANINHVRKQGIYVPSEADDV